MKELDGELGALIEYKIQVDLRIEAEGELESNRRTLFMELVKYITEDNQEVTKKRRIYGLKRATLIVLNTATQMMKVEQPGWSI